MQFGSDYILCADPTETDSVSEVVSFSSPPSGGPAHDDGETCLIDMLDTAGQEEYSCMRDQYMRTGDGFMIVFDLTSQRTLEEARDLYAFAQRIKDQDRVPAVLVGNKSDLEAQRQVSADDATEVAAELGLVYFETSAKWRVNIDEAIHELVRQCPRHGVEYKL